MRHRSFLTKPRHTQTHLPRPSSFQMSPYPLNNHFVSRATVHSSLKIQNPGPAPLSTPLKYANPILSHSHPTEILPDSLHHQHSCFSLSSLCRAWKCLSRVQNSSRKLISKAGFYHNMQMLARVVLAWNRATRPTRGCLLITGINFVFASSVVASARDVCRRKWKGYDFSGRCELSSAPLE